MAAKTRSSKKPSASAKASDAGKRKGGKSEQQEKKKEDEQQQQLPLLSRAVIIMLTSFVAEKIWRYRTVVSEGWYSDTQSATERAMITAFEYIVAMGMLFFMGILISTVTMTAQRKLGL